MKNTYTSSYQLQVDLLADNALKCSDFGTAASSFYITAFSQLLNGSSTQLGIFPPVQFAKTAITASCEAPATGTRKRIRLLATTPAIPLATAAQLLDLLSQTWQQTKLIKIVAGLLPTTAGAWMPNFAFYSPLNFYYQSGGARLGNLQWAPEVLLDVRKAAVGL